MFVFTGHCFVYKLKSNSAQIQRTSVKSTIKHAQQQSNVCSEATICSGATLASPLHLVRKIAKGVISACVLTGLLSTQSFAAGGNKVTVTGEMIDTWCYVSQIMGSSEAVTGTAHHVCAVWCAAGGIPVGLLDKETETVYMILSFEGDDTSVANEKILNLQSRELTVKGTAFELDGISYLNIDDVITDHGIVNLTHEKFGIVPGFAGP